MAEEREEEEEAVKRYGFRTVREAATAAYDEHMADKSPSSTETIFTVRNAIKVGLFWATEYALLSLIEDAPRIIKWATLVFPLGALAALQYEQKLREFHRDLFGITITTLTVSYLTVAAVFGFIYEAPTHTTAISQEGTVPKVDYEALQDRIKTLEYQVANSPAQADPKPPEPQTIIDVTKRLSSGDRTRLAEAAYDLSQSFDEGQRLYFITNSDRLYSRE